MSTTSPELTGSRAATADQVIAAMAGAGATLRDGPVRRGRGAVRARRPGARRPGHRLGQVGGLLGGHGDPPRGGRGPDAGRLAAAVAHARPGGRGRAGGAARRHPQLLQRRRVVARSSSALPRGEIDVLLVSPERLANPGFGRRVLDALAGRLGLLVIDEAHAVSDWGHDFRPDYRRVVRRAAAAQPGHPGARHHRDRQRAGDRRRGGAAGRVDAGAARPARPGQPAARRRARADARWSATPGWSTTCRTCPGSGIVYALTVADAERLAAAIQAVHGPAVPVAAYTGQLDPDERERLEDALRANEVKALVATSALGMGYDKPDLGFVVHVGSPPSPVSYYQQVGRAGRAIDHAARASLLPVRRGRGRVGLLRDGDHPRPASRCTACWASSRPRSRESVPSRWRPQSGCAAGRLELMLKQLAVDGACRAGRRRLDRAPASRLALRRRALRRRLATRRREADIMRGLHPRRSAASCSCSRSRWTTRTPSRAVAARSAGAGCQTPLAATPQARDRRGRRPRRCAARCTSSSRARCGRAAPSAPAAGSAPTRQRRRGGPSSGPTRRSGARSPPRCGSTTARRPTRCSRPVSAFSPSGARSWRARPEVVVDLAGSGPPRFTASVADHLASVGRLDRASPTVKRPPDDLRDRGSGEEAAWWRDAIDVAAAADAVAGRSVLLVVGASATLWPVTVGAAALRRAGASLVLPLLIHRQP